MYTWVDNITQIYTHSEFVIINRLFKILWGKNPEISYFELTKEIIKVLYIYVP